MNAQGTEAWFFDRCGMITASGMFNAFAFSEGGEYKSGKKKGEQKEVRPLKSRIDYIRQLATERITGRPKNSARAAPMEWGKQWEPVAKSLYENSTGTLIREVSFLVHPKFEFIGASADWLELFGTDGGGEIKCPYDQEVHLSTLEDGLPEEHIAQIQGGLWVTDRKWWDFISFHPHFPEHLRLYIQRVYRDEEYISKLESACIVMNDEINSIVRKHMEKAA